MATHGWFTVYVLFTSDVVGGKLSGAVGQNALLLSRMHEAKNGWKLTLKDDGSEDAVGDGHSGFTVGTATTKDGSILTIPYQNAATGDNEYISAIITDQSGRITYYGRLKNIKAASDARGEVKANISGKLATGDSLHIFNEQFNGDKTDYASAVVEVAIPEGCSLWRSDLTKDPIKWRVLQNEEGKLFLLSDKILDAKPYNNDTKNYNDAITWAQCTLRSWLNGYDKTENMESEDYTDDNFIDEAFDKGEQKSIATTALLNNQYNPFAHVNPSNPPEGFGGADTEDKVFLLSLSDAINEDFGFEEGSLGEQRIIDEYGEEQLFWGYERSESRVVQMTDYVSETPVERGDEGIGYTIGEQSGQPTWGLRSPGSLPQFIEKVNRYGIIVDGWAVGSQNYYNVWIPVGIRPAMNIDLETVAFTSTATGGKLSGAVGSGALKYVEGNPNDEWKLTAIQNHEDFSIDTDSIVYNGKNKVTVSFAGAVTGGKEYISALVKAKDGSVKYYGRILKPSAASGSLTIDIPDGYTCDDTLYVFNEQYNGDKMTDYCSELLEVPFEAEGHDWTWTSISDSQHKGVCKRDEGHTRTENHTWDSGRVTKEATTTATGIKTFTCTKCAATRTDVIPKVIKGTGADPNLKGSDGMALGTGASAAAADKAITSMKKDTDPAGSKFAKLQFKSTKQTKKSVKIAWKKVSGAKKYVIYGNACGSKNKMKKLATVTGASKNFTKILGKKVKKGTYYKFLVVALDKNNKVVSSSKLIHVATTGGKVGNHKSVTVKAKVGKKTKAVSKVTVKKGKTMKLKTTLNPKNKKLKVKKHVGARYESTNTKIATVSGKGVIKGKKKGTCYVYVYAQNGVFKKVKVTVK